MHRLQLYEILVFDVFTWEQKFEFRPRHFSAQVAPFLVGVFSPVNNLLNNGAIGFALKYDQVACWSRQKILLWNKIEERATSFYNLNAKIFVSCDGSFVLINKF